MRFPLPIGANGFSNTMSNTMNGIKVAHLRANTALVKTERRIKMTFNGKELSGMALVILGILIGFCIFS